MRVAACALLALAVAAPQEDEARERRCGFCSTTGRTEFLLDRKWNIESEGGASWGVVACSEAIAADNMAMSWQPCKLCKTPSMKAAAEGEYEAIRARNETWLAERRQVDRDVKGEDPLVHLETTHFVLAWGIPKITASDNRTYRAHDAAHLYARRLEELYAEFQSSFGISDASNLKNKHYLYAFDEPAAMHRAGPIYTGLQGETTVKRSGGVDHESVIVTWWDKTFNPTEDDLHRHVVHNMIHQWTSVYYDPNWFQPGQFGLLPPWLNDKYGWLDEGLAHWFERRMPGRSTTYCFREQDNNSRWKGDSWDRNVWKSVIAGDVPPFSEVITKPTQALSAKEHQFCWAWVDYLMARDRAAMGRMLRRAKEKAPTRDLLKEGWDLTVAAFETGWSDWVKTNYAVKSAKAR